MCAKDACPSERLRDSVVANFKRDKKQTIQQESSVYFVTLTGFNSFQGGCLQSRPAIEIPSYPYEMEYFIDADPVYVMPTDHVFTSACQTLLEEVVA